MRTLASVSEDEKKMIAKDIVVNWGEQGMVDKLAIKHNVKNTVLQAMVGNLRKKGVTIKSVSHIYTEYLQPAYIEELKSLSNFK